MKNFINSLVDKLPINYIKFKNFLLGIFMFFSTNVAAQSLVGFGSWKKPCTDCDSNTSRVNKILNSTNYSTNQLQIQHISPKEKTKKIIYYNPYQRFLSKVVNLGYKPVENYTFPLLSGEDKVGGISLTFKNGNPYFTIGIGIPKSNQVMIYNYPLPKIDSLFRSLFNLSDSVQLGYGIFSFGPKSSEVISFDNSTPEREIKINPTSDNLSFDTLNNFVIEIKMSYQGKNYTVHLFYSNNSNDILNPNNILKKIEVIDSQIGKTYGPFKSFNIFRKECWNKILEYYKKYPNSPVFAPCSSKSSQYPYYRKCCNNN